ncbi:MAG: methylenetetrahydrofolate reductase [Candidatus Nanopelagicales bacterium]|jgi:methylenetetrahydrofolate reductase (NADPH)
MSRLATLLAEGSRPVVTAEFPSIDGGGLAAVEKAANELRPFVDAVNATDNPAAHAHASNTSIAIAMSQFGLEPIMQVVCRDKNRIAMQADIMGASLFGIENIACLTGDDVTAGDEPEARRVFDLDSTQLVKVASGLAEGHYLSGRAIKQPPALFVGAVENPFAPPLDYRVLRALKKAEAGARFLQLQIGYYPERLESFVAGCVEHGVTRTTALLPTVVLTKSAKALSFMDESVPGISIPADMIARVAGAGDKDAIAEESYQLTLELSRHALSLPGVSGIHLTDFRHDGSLERLVRDLGIGPAFASTSDPVASAAGTTSG